MVREARSPLTLWQLGALCSDSARHAESRQCALYERLGEHEVRLCDVRGRDDRRRGATREVDERGERVRLEDKDAAVVGAEVVNLLAIHVEEEVLADKLYQVEMGREWWSCERESGVRVSSPAHFSATYPPTICPILSVRFATWAVTSSGFLPTAASPSASASAASWRSNANAAESDSADNAAGNR